MDQDIDEAAAARPRRDRQPPGGPARRLTPEARRRIGLGLRALYADLLAQPIPERFTALVADWTARSAEEAPR